MRGSFCVRGFPFLYAEGNFLRPTDGPYIIFFGTIGTNHEEARADAPILQGQERNKKIYTGTNLWYNVRDGKVHIFPRFCRAREQSMPIRHNCLVENTSFLTL